MLYGALRSFGDFANHVSADRTISAEADANPKRKLDLTRRPSEFEEINGVSAAVPKNKQRDAALDRIRKTLKGLVSEHDYQSIIKTAAEYENLFEEIPTDAAKISSMTRVDLVTKLLNLSGKRNTFVAKTSRCSENTPSEISRKEHARRINNRMPVLTQKICDYLVDSFLQCGTEAMNTSPIGKPDAPLIRSHVDGISYSKPVAPMHHSATRKERQRFDDLAGRCPKLRIRCYNHWVDKYYA